MSASKQPSWLDPSRYRWLELLSELGGSNLFFVSGDALLLELIAEKHISWLFDTPHLLHVIFTIERFLEQLLQAGCVFRVVFFAGLRPFYRNLAIHGRHSGPAALIAREVLIQHLKRCSLQNTSEENSRLFVDVQDGWWTEEWAAFLKSEAPSFMLLSHLEHVQGTLPALFESLLANLVANRTPLALIKPLQFMDNHIHTLCNESYFNEKDQPLHALAAAGARRILAAPQSEPLALPDVESALVELRKSSHDSRTSALVLAARSLHLRSAPKSAQRDLIKVLVLHLALLEVLPLESRSWHLPPGLKTPPPFLSEFFAHFAGHLDPILHLLVHDSSLVDLYDCRLFAVLLHGLLSARTTAVEAKDFGAPVCARVEALWVLVAPGVKIGPLFESSDLQHLVGRGFGDFASAAAVAPPNDPLPVRSPISDAIFSDYGLPHVPSQADYDKQKRYASFSQKFFDEWHWHSGKRITLDESSIADEGVTGARSEQTYMTFLDRFSRSLNARQTKPLRTSIVTSATIQVEINAERIKPLADTVSSEEQQFASLEKLCDGAPITEARTTLESFRPKTHTVGVAAEFRLLAIISEQYRRVRRDSPQLGAMMAKDLMRRVLDLAECYRASTLFTPARKSQIVAAAELVGLNDLADAFHRAFFNKPLPPSDFPELSPGGFSSARYQLNWMGPYMERDVASIKDPRVPFLADDWQVRVLDAIDQRKSLLVVAPTSAGKTFISFYAIEQVLRNTEKTDTVVVYVAPTKALVNQTAAEVYAKFAKATWLKNKPGVKTTGIFTRDYRHFPSNCRVLITVPQCLEILLLAPTHFSTWRERLRYVIFDEVHSINQEEGSVWERLISMVPCPAIALSATIGQSAIFASWLNAVATRNNHGFEHVVHQHRYSDLNKSLLIYDRKAHTADLAYLHPWACLTAKEFARAIPPDISLSPQDCLHLFLAMETAVKTWGGVEAFVEETDKAQFLACNPDNFFREHLVVTQKKCRVYEQFLKGTVQSWINLGRVALIETTLRSLRNDPLGLFDKMLAQKPDSTIYDKQFTSTALPAVVEMLRQRNLLPAILFNFERRYCEEMAMQLLIHMERKERTWRSSPEYQLQVKRFLESKREQASIKEKASKLKRPDALAEEMTASEQGVNPADLMAPGCTLTDVGEIFTSSELEEDAALLFESKVEPLLVRALARGIGVHHAGLPKKYLQTVERYFRSGQLKAVFATGTLALGINMPCRTAVFVGDSPYLTPLQYRQMSGRAGRRGFDPEGQVVFLSVPPEKIRKLESSHLPILNGHFPFTTTFVLRSLILAAGTDDFDKLNSIRTYYEPKKEKASGAATVEAPDSWESLLEEEAPAETVAPEPVAATPPGEVLRVDFPKAVANIARTISGFFSNPLFCHQRNFLQEQVTSHVRFSLEFLVQSGLISLHGEPLGLAGIASHLFYTEPANFLICQLLVSDAVHDLCRRAREDWTNVSRALIHLLSWLFCRVPRVPERKKDEYHHIELPNPDPTVARVFDRHEATVLQIFTSSVVHFVRTNADRLGRDDSLPLSHLKLPIGSAPPQSASASATDCPFENFMKAALPSPEQYNAAKITHIARSPFVALSGHGDVFELLRDLCTTSRQGVYLPSDAMPSLHIYDLSGEQIPLNAFILDMWNWSNRDWLREKNGMRDADIFAQSKDFMLILKTIATALARRVSSDGTLGQATSDPAANAFLRLAEEFEERHCKMFDLPIKRRFVVFVGGIVATKSDFKRIPIDRDIKDKTRLAVTSRFNSLPNRKIELKIYLNSAADLKTLVDKKDLWLKPGWFIASYTKPQYL